MIFASGIPVKASGNSRSLPFWKYYYQEKGGLVYSKVKLLCYGFFGDMCVEKTPYRRKIAFCYFSRAQGWYWRSITTDCRLWRIKGGCYGAAVKENSRSKRIFSLGTARVGSAVRKSLIFERAASPSKSVANFSTRSCTCRRYFFL